MVVDGHNFMFKTLCILPLGKNGMWLETKKDVDMFSSKLMQNFVAGVRDFKNIIGNIVFTVDSASWRKSLGVYEYKAGRHTEEKINWDNFKECANKFYKELNDMGVTISKAEGAEADDLIFYWSNKLTTDGVPVIINSSDKDMLQLVRNNNGTNCECLQYSTVTKKLYVPDGFVKKRESAMPKSIDDFFSSGKNTGVVERYGQLSDLVKKKKLELLEINADRELVVKILTGDKSDNIPSAYTVEKNGRVYGITELKADSVLAKFREKTGEPFCAELLFVEQAVEMLGACVKEVAKADCELEKITKGITENTKYIFLSYHTIPNNIVENMRGCVNISEHKKQKINLDAILAKNTSPVEMSIGVLKGAEETDYSFIKNKSKNGLF